MAKKRQKIKIYIDPVGNTLNMWWGNPDSAYLSDESKTTNDIFIRNKKGEYIGMEKIVFFPPDYDPVKIIPLTSKEEFLLTEKSGVKGSKAKL